MKIEFLNPFIAAAATVLEKEAGTKVSRGQVALQKGLYESEDVTALVSLVGQVEGTVLYSLSYDTAKALVSQMLSQQLSDFNELAQSGIAELANVITGLSSTNLSQAGYASIISVPMLLIGKGSRISTLGGERLVIPIETQFGRFGLNLALRENSNAPQEFDSYTFRAPILATGLTGLTGR